MHQDCHNSRKNKLNDIQKIHDIQKKTLIDKFNSDEVFSAQYLLDG